MALETRSPKLSLFAKVLPSLFENNNSSRFQCEICRFAKHHLTIFPFRPYKESKPFSLIHSDIWGLFKVTNLSGIKWFITFIDNHTRVYWVYL